MRHAQTRWEGVHATLLGEREIAAAPGSYEMASCFQSTGTLAEHARRAQQLRARKDLFGREFCAEQRRQRARNALDAVSMVTRVGEALRDVGADAPAKQDRLQFVEAEAARRRNMKKAASAPPAAPTALPCVLPSASAGSAANNSGTAGGGAREFLLEPHTISKAELLLEPHSKPELLMGGMGGSYRARHKERQRWRRPKRQFEHDK